MFSKLSRRSILVGLTATASSSSALSRVPLASAIVAQNRKVIPIRRFGAVGDGKVDDTKPWIEALKALKSGEILDLQGLRLRIFVGVEGAESGDAVSLSDTPRLVGKNDITIRDGMIFADAPGVSAKKLRYPTTLTIDGCRNVTLEKLVLYSKGENWGDTDASARESKERRRSFAAQNGGHALLIVRSAGTAAEDCEMRLCGSVGSCYVMSSHDTTLKGCFSNPGSLGYAAFCFDSWAGDVAVTGFRSHDALMIDCAASKEKYAYGSKGCVLTEDVDVSVTVERGYFADAYPNGTARDLGYAFGCSSSRTFVRGALVKNCASLGYTGTTTRTDASELLIRDVRATNLRRTVHQTEATNVGRMDWRYQNVVANLVGGGAFRGDGNLGREKTSFVSIMNLGSLIFGEFKECSFSGAEYGFINGEATYGRLKFQDCHLETNGWLWSSANVGSGRPGRGVDRGIYFLGCEIRDRSRQQSAYALTVSKRIYTHIDLASSRIFVREKRKLHDARIPDQNKFVEAMRFPTYALWKAQDNS